ncbi:hypothetical protein HPB51_029307 [Rhipicephalus microplus]|uniref:Tick transposon n=1 Tax=Rhipicephalus microplus TaxID=6941 RepID=A0A9J6CV36_RHIMP|nr:hypothetical protein HPB51_029307 [Rhipicephalus microplus]
MELTSTLGLTLHTDPAYSSRVCNSVTRDTRPNLSFTKNIRHADWANTEETLCSNHCILNIIVTTNHWHGRWMKKRTRALFHPAAVPLTRPHVQARLPDWTKFRKIYSNLTPIHETGYHPWSQEFVTHLRSTETQVQLSEAMPEADSHLLHLWQARHTPFHK